MSYGQIAALLAQPLSARAVGWAMRACPSGLPWHRVVNARGGCSSDGLPDHPGLQRALLEAEGIAFDEAGHLSMEQHRWVPRAAPVRQSKARSKRPKSKVPPKTNAPPADLPPRAARGAGGVKSRRHGRRAR